MHPRVMAERRAQAQTQMSEAVGALSDRFGVSMPGRPAVRLADPAAIALFDLERVAVFLDALVTATEPEPEPAPKTPASRAAKKD